MSIEAKLALKQLKNNPKRTLYTLFGIILAISTLVTLGGFATSGVTTMSTSFTELYGTDSGMAATNMILALSVIFIIIVIFVTIIVISSAFKLSDEERIKQFSILKSVGAEQKQIIAVVVYEGFFLSLIGMPIGLFLGIIVQFIATSTANAFIGYEATTLTFTIVPIFVIVALIGSFCIVLISCWLPARKAAKIPAIISIRGNNNNIKIKHIRTSFIIKKLFGFEGELAIKQLKRNNKHLKSIVVSICFGIVLILFATSLQTHMLFSFEGRGTQLGLDFINNNTTGVNLTYMSPHPEISTFNSQTAEIILEELSRFPNTQVSGRGMREFSLLGSEFRVEELDSKDIITIIKVDNKTYEELIMLAGLQEGDSIFINVALELDNQHNFIQSKAFDNAPNSPLTIYPIIATPIENLTESYTYEILDNPTTINIDGQITSLPQHLLTLADFTGSIIVPEIDVMHYQWFAITQDINGYTEHANEVFQHYMAMNEFERFGFINTADEVEPTVAYINFISIFILLFSVMLILLSFTNVVNTIVASIQFRAKEFALLLSIGMDKKGIYKILNLECIISSVYATVIGTPLGILAIWISHQIVISGAIGNANFFNLPLIMPWLVIFFCIIGIFMTTFVTMRISMQGFGKYSIIETIRRTEMN